MTDSAAVPECPEKYYRAAYKVARRYAKSDHTTVGDMAQVGIAAVAEHWGEWDPALCNRLTWVMLRCRWACGQHVARTDGDRVIRVPAGAVRRGHKRPAVQCIDERDRTGRLTAERDRGTWRYDAAADLDGPPAVGPLLAVLGPRSREVVERRCGLGGRPAQTFREIARELGLSRARAQQVWAAAVAAMRLAALAKGVRS